MMNYQAHRRKAFRSSTPNPLWGNVSLLLKGDGVDGSTTITDLSSFGHVLAIQGNIQNSTAQSKFDGSSIYSDGDSVNRLACPPSSAFSLMDRIPFTIESFLYIPASSVPGNRGIFSFRTSVVYCEVVVQCENSNRSFRILIGASPASWQTVAITSPSSYPFNQWFHLLISGDGSLIRLFCNGTKIGEWNHPAWSGWSTSRPFYVLGETEGGYLGWADEIRFMKGTCLYTSDFTPPAAPFPIG